MVPMKQLTSELSIPMIGFGTWRLKGQEGLEAVRSALEVGYRHIDTADRYGNHTEVGEAIRASKVARSDIFLTTKVWRDRLRRVDVLADVDRFLLELGTEYIDLLLIHWPNREVPVEETLLAMEECRQAGKIKAIGVSNFTEKHLKEAQEASVAIVNNQIELHPSFSQPALRAFCGQAGISVTAYSPLRSGDMDELSVRDLATKYERSPAQVILNWLISRDLIVIPQTTNPQRMKENLAAADFSMTEEDLAILDVLPQGSRYNDPDFGEFGGDN